MNQEIRKNKITENLNLDKLPSSLGKININDLGSLISEFIHYIFAERIKSMKNKTVTREQKIALRKQYEAMN